MQELKMDELESVVGGSPLSDWYKVLQDWLDYLNQP